MKRATVPIALICRTPKSRIEQQGAPAPQRCQLLLRSPAADEPLSLSPHGLRLFQLLPPVWLSLLLIPAQRCCGLVPGCCTGSAPHVTSITAAFNRSSTYGCCDQRHSTA